MKSRARLMAVGLALVLGGALIVTVVPEVAVADAGVDTTAAVAFQHDPAHDGDSVDPALTAPFTRAWQLALGDSSSYPLIVNGRIFLAYHNPAGMVLEAFSTTDGSRVWGPKATGSGTSLAYDAGQVFSVDQSGNMAAYDAATGVRNWYSQMPGQYSFTSPPTALDGTVYTGGAGIGGTVYAVDETTGVVKWTSGVENGDDSSPAVDANGVYVSYACEQAYRFGLDGSLTWHHSTGCEGGGGDTAVLHGGDLFIRDSSYSPAILDGDTGTAVGTFNSDQPPAFDGTDMVGVSNGVETVTDTTTDDIQWTSPNADAVTAPLVAHGYVFVGRQDGIVEARDLQTGSVVWTGQVATAMDYSSSLAEGDGVLAVSANGTLTVFKPLVGDTTVTLTGGPADDAYTPAYTTFSFTSSISDPQYICTLDGRSQPCTSPVTYRGLIRGPHHFSVSVDYADTGAASRSFVVDKQPPRVSLRAFSPRVTTSSHVVARWAAKDKASGVATSTLVVQRTRQHLPPTKWRPLAPVQGRSETLPIARHTKLCVMVMATDEVGNVSHISTPQCVVRR